MACPVDRTLVRLSRAYSDNCPFTDSWRFKARSLTGWEIGGFETALLTNPFEPQCVAPCGEELSSLGVSLS